MNKNRLNEKTSLEKTEHNNIFSEKDPLFKYVQKLKAIFFQKLKL